jgi:hypothetical protein
MSWGQFDNVLFSMLSPEQEKEFREYARTTDPPDITKWELYHPVCRQEWEARGISPANYNCLPGGK